MTSIKQIRKWLPALSIGTAVLLLVTVGVLLWHHAASPHKRSTQASVAASMLPDVTVRSTPSGAHILRDGQEIGIAAPTLTFRMPKVKTSLEARLEGYESQSETIDSSAGRHGEINFALRPLGQQLRIAGRGTLSLDGGAAAALPMGAFAGELAAGKHTLHWHGRGGYDATFEVNVRDSTPATLTAPIHASQSGAALVVSIAAQQAHLYTNPVMSVIVDGAAKGIANGSGLDTPLPAGLHTMIARRYFRGPGWNHGHLRRPA